MHFQLAVAARSRSRSFRWIVAIGLAIAIVASVAGQAGLAAKKGKVITLGESLTDAQRQEMLDFFKKGPNDKVYTITEAETNEAMKGILDDIGQGVTGAYSSTALTCRNLGEGLEVQTRNISLVTPSMYAMALVTAGIGDATLVVSGPYDSSALGTTALAGVFKTWDLAPCESGNTSKERQRLALEELALTAEIGQAISSFPGATDGVQPAANVILETQKTIVIERLKKKSDIDAALRAQEAAAGIAIPEDKRTELIDLFVRLAKADIDWSTFSAGWTITYNESNTKITMTGEGIAIRRARQTATAQAAAAKTATAEARFALTATAQAQAELTATAQAAAATQQAIAAMTATAAAQPTATPTPQPTPTPAPFAVTGTIAQVGDSQISIKPAGGNDAVTYMVDADARVTRDGKPSRLDALAKGDSVTLTVDGNTQHVREIAATAAPVSVLAKVTKLWWLLPAIGVLGGLVVARGKIDRDPFVVKRVAAA